MAGGRRGSFLISYDTIMALVIFALFTYACFSFIAAKANGDVYFSRFYAQDLAAAADVVNAGAGDVVLRYDNMKHNANIAFRLDNGRVRAGPVGQKVESVEIPVDAATGYYGRAPQYVGDTQLIRPQYLVLRKAGDAFAINTAETYLQVCPTAQPPADKSAAVSISGLTAEETASMQESVSKILSNAGIRASDAAITRMRVSITKGSSQNTITLQPTNKNGQALACQFLKQLDVLTVIPFTVTGPAEGSSNDVVLTIATRNDVNLKNEQVAQAIAHSIALYYGGS